MHCQRQLASRFCCLVKVLDSLAEHKASMRGICDTREGGQKMLGKHHIMISDTRASPAQEL